MKQSLWNIVEEFRKEGFHIEDEDAEAICQHCYKKMKVAKIQNCEEYLPLLYRNEILDYCFRRTVNATTMLRMMQKEGMANV